MYASKMSSGSTTPSSTDRVKWYLPECRHNHFNHSRVKKGKAWLCCRDCGTKWRTPHPLHSLCPEFYETRGFCSLGSSCPYLHVHRFKCTERSPTHDDYVGKDRDDLLRECAIAVLTEYLPSQRFPRDVMPQIRALYEARRGEMNIPPACRAHSTVTSMSTSNAIAVETVEEQQIIKFKRTPMPPMPPKMIATAPMLFSPSLGAHSSPDVTGLNPTFVAQQQLLAGPTPLAYTNSSHTAEQSGLSVTAPYMHIRCTQIEGRGQSLDFGNETLNNNHAH